jgi:hypothetical protein
MSYAEGVFSFREVEKETKAPNAYTILQNLDQDKTCHIAQAADLVIMLTKGLDESKGVFKIRGTALSATWTEVSFASCAPNITVCSYPKVQQLESQGPRQ